MPPSAADQIVETASYLLQHGDRSGAESLVAQALRLEPGHAKAQELTKRIKGATNPAVARAWATPTPQREVAATGPAMFPPQVSLAVGTGTTPLPGALRTPAPGGDRRTAQFGLASQDFSVVLSAARSWRESLSGAETAPPPATVGPATPPAPATAAAEWALVVLTGPKRGQQLEVGSAPLALGRGGSGLDLADDRWASPAHATLAVRDGSLYVTDGGSASGTWLTIDGATRLAAGDSFSAGQQRLRYLGPLRPPSPSSFPELGGPFPAASWRLEQTLEGLRAGRTWVLRGIVTLGREGQGIAFAEDQALAPHHADLRPSGEGLDLVDRSEGLGTWICLPARGERRVPPGALLRLGATVLQPSPR